MTYKHTQLYTDSYLVDDKQKKKETLQKPIRVSDFYVMSLKKS